MRITMELFSSQFDGQGMLWYGLVKLNKVILWTDRLIPKCNISAISQPIIMKLGIHITYGYTVTDKYFQNFRSKVKVVGRRKVKNVIWPYLGNELS